MPKLDLHSIKKNNDILKSSETKETIKGGTTQQSPGTRKKSKSKSK